MNTPSRSSTRRVTIKTVAEEAGVSVGTASRVLNNRSGVHDATRLRVLEAMQRLNYRPDQSARELSFAQNRTIGLHVSQGMRRLHPFFAYFLGHLSTALRESGLRFEEVGSRSDGMPDRLTDGLVLLGAHDDDLRLQYLQDQGVPYVLLGHRPETACVAPDDVDGGRQVGEHLLRLGHQRIAFLAGGLHSQASHDRLVGLRTSLEAAGVGFNNETDLFEGGNNDLEAYRVTRRLLEDGLDATAVFAASDEMASGVVAAIRDVGLQVPYDISVVGFDDIEEIAGDWLTTVRQDVGRLSDAAVSLLQEMMEGGPKDSVLLPVQLIPRSTTARVRK